MKGQNSSFSGLDSLAESALALSDNGYFENILNRKKCDMSYSIDIYVANSTPKQVLELFNVYSDQVKTDYAVSKKEGIYYSSNTLEQKLVENATGIIPHVFGSYIRDSNNVTDVSPMTTRLINNAIHKIQSDFIVLSNAEKIIAMRRKTEILIDINANKLFGIDLGILNMPHTLDDLATL